MMIDASFLAREHLQALIDALHDTGYLVLGPVVKDHAIQFSEITDAARLPVGWHDSQAPGRYRLNQSDSGRCFAWANGPQAIKPLLFRPTETLWRATRAEDGHLRFEAPEFEAEPTALIGARPCDLAALALHDRQFIDNGPDPAYAARRAALFIVAVNCTHPADTCFCASTGDGPAAHQGYDIALTELDDGFLVSAASERGQTIGARLPLVPAEEAQQAAAETALNTARDRQHRALPTGDLQKTLFDRLDHPRWEETAARCLSCGNCTSVCPTCFCHRQRDQAELNGESTEHIREWDSCFTAGHSYLHGYQVRPQTRHRYRQWLTHKLGSWHEQFGRSGCVGCGRCITWCPVGIDITAEARALCNDAAEARP